MRYTVLTPKLMSHGYVDLEQVQAWIDEERIVPQTALRGEGSRRVVQARDLKGVKFPKKAFEVPKYQKSPDAPNWKILDLLHPPNDDAMPIPTDRHSSRIDALKYDERGWVNMAFAVFGAVAASLLYVPLWAVATCFVLLWLLAVFYFLCAIKVYGMPTWILWKAVGVLVLMSIFWLALPSFW
jgi:hypothetical protein